MTKTAEEIATAALRHLGVVSTGEAATAEEIAHAKQALDGVMAEMSNSQGLFLEDVDLTPDEYFIPLYQLLAVEVAPHFSLPAANRANAVMRLRQAAQETPLPTTVEANYF